MTTTFFLVRHATHDLVEHALLGREGQVRLSALGRRQAKRLAARFREDGVSLVQSSPRERARQTAEAIAAAAGTDCETVPALDEIDVGEWTGRSFAELADDPHWQAWNSRRQRTRAPGGETMVEAQARIVGQIGRMCAGYPGARVVMVSHCDVIKAALLHFLGKSLDNFHRIEIAPASVSTLVVGGWGAKIVALNERIGR